MYQALLFSSECLNYIHMHSQILIHILLVCFFNFLVVDFFILFSLHGYGAAILPELLLIVFRDMLYSSYRDYRSL